MGISESNAPFDDALEGLRGGDFSRLDSLFQSKDGSRPQIVEWVDQGRFRGHDQELTEALTLPASMAEPKSLNTCCGGGLHPQAERAPG